MIADQATNAVAEVIGRSGHAVERVLNDYGEDLLVQTAHAGRMDACRLWVQVKGTTTLDRFRVADGGYRLTVPFRQALRWLRTLDSVVVVLWDVSAGRGWFADPKEQVDELGSLGQKTVTLRFNAARHFKEEVIDGLVWQTRLYHYSTLFADAQQNHEFSKDIGSDEPPLRLAALGLDLLVTLGLVVNPEPDQFSLADPARQRFREALMASGHAVAVVLPKEADLRDDAAREALLKAAMVTLASAFDDPHILLPVNFVGVCSDLIIGLAGFRRPPG